MKNKRKISTVRKLLIIGLMAFFAFPLFASAQNTKVSISLRNATVKQVLNEIEKQTDFTFVYSDARVNINRVVTVKAKNKPVNSVVEHIFAGTNIVFRTVDNQIVLMQKVENSNMEIRNEKQLSITGTVTDAEDGLQLPGVNVKVKGSYTGTITDLNGDYLIEIGSKDDVLVFSFIGYKTKEVQVSNNRIINVQLEAGTEEISEVVVVGYGTSSKKLLTSSITSIDSKQIEDAVSNGIESALQGKTAGVQIVQNSGTPGAAMSVNIRGKSSISAGTQPLYVIDGIPMTTGNYGQIGFEGQGIDAAADINPNNIESISILKDASAAAIYGARAGNGVILITTKSGKANQSRIQYKTYFGMQKAWKKLDMLNAGEWREYVATFNPDFVAELDPTIDTDWQEEVLRTAPIQNHELSITGGEQRTRYFISGRYFNQEGIVLGSAYEKYNGTLNIDHDVNNDLSFEARITTNYSINDRVVGDQTINGVLPNAISKPPVYAVKDENGNYLEEGFWDNPVAIGNEVTNQARTFRNISNIAASYKITSDLVFKNQWGFDFYNLNERRYEPITVDRGAESNGIGISARSDVFKLTQQSTLKYSKTFNSVHNIDVLAGYSFERSNLNYNFIRGNNFPSDQLEYLVSAGNIEEASSEAYFDALQSVFGRINYNYSDKYIFSVSVRHDGSSNFGENNKYATLPAASTAWRIGKEDFMMSVGAISELKLKLSFGLTGNDNIGAFRSRNLYSSGYNYYGNAGIIPTQIPNPDLKWETTTNTNVGLELGLFNDKIMLSADAYYNKTTDLLLDRPLPGSSGFTAVSANVGALQNRGLEVQLSTENLDDELKWNTSINISLNRNKILELYKNQPITDVGRGQNAAIVGEPLGVFYMYRSLGVDPSTGDLVFEDVNNDNQITDEDRTIVGDPNPDFTGGFVNTLSYKGLSLDVFLQFVYGNDIFNGTRQYAEAMAFGDSDNQLSTIKDRWQQPGDITYIPRNKGTNNLFPLSSHYIEDGSYLRVKNVMLSYTLPTSVLVPMKLIKNLRVYVKAENLYTLTPYSGLDPDVNYAGVGALHQGTDFFTYPHPRSFIAGINFTF